MGWSSVIFCVAAVHAVEVAENATQMLHLHLAASVDSECSDTASVSRATCLGKSKCMFLELDKRNLCLPCEWAGQPLPCVPRNAAYPQGRVESCEMSCEHQQMVSKVSDCTDVSGEIRQDDCMAKGKSAGVSCMWTSYTRKDGTRRSMCGPCKVDGLGSVGRSAPGSYGPEAGSIVEASFSQCDAQQLEAAKPCLDPSKCPKTLPAIPPETGDAPVALSDLTRLGMNTTADAPEYFAAPVSPPYGKEETCQQKECGHHRMHVLINIFSMLFNFKSEVSNQLELQNWYFWFMVFFVIGVTVVGQNFLKFVGDVANEPTALPMLLAEKMPSSTHYYLNFLVLQWVTHGMNLTRYVQVAKYVGFSKLWSEDDARALAEPEDQDYYGMGSRSARFTINMLIAIIFGTLSPLMYLLAWVNFYLCRVIYGYLFLYAETRKEDSGGFFFVNQLHHVYAGLFFYCLLMIGIFLERAPNYVPAGFGVVAFIYAFASYRAYIYDFEWETLPWEEIAQGSDGKDFQPEDSGENYIQTELLDALPDTGLS